MKKILFVDDEENILQGLRRMLRPMRKEWDMYFANGGQEAITLIQQKFFNAVITDMKMPVVDGVKVLEFVKEYDPSIARLVLSGQSDQDSALKLTSTAHQYISKPCNTEELKQNVEKAFRLRELLHNEGVVAIVSGIDSLPSLPEIYTRLSAEMIKNDQDFSITRVGDIVSEDVAMSAKILQLSNSSFFGLVSHVESVNQAVINLGCELVRTLCIGNAVFKSFPLQRDATTLEDIWEHSLEVSAVATALCRHEKASAEVVDQANQAGILHEVGRLIIATALPDMLTEINNIALDENISVHAAEQQLLECNHGQIGGYLLCLWGLPDSIVEAVTYHHQPELCQIHNNEFSPLAAVHVANVLVECHRDDRQVVSEQLDMQWLKALEVDEKLQSWVDLTHELLEKKASFNE